MPDRAVSRYHQAILPASAIFGMALVLFGMAQTSPQELFDGLLAGLIHSSVVLQAGLPREPD